MFEKDLNFAVLLDIYGEILTVRQREMMELYYNEDFSLSEISQNTEISRQGVRASLKKSEETLIHLEDTLKLARRFSTVQSECERISAELLNAVDEFNFNSSKSVTVDGLQEKILKISEKIKNISP